MIKEINMNKKIVLRFEGNKDGELLKSSKTISNIYDQATDEGLVKLSKAVEQIVDISLKEALKVTTESLNIA